MEGFTAQHMVGCMSTRRSSLSFSVSPLMIYVVHVDYFRKSLSLILSFAIADANRLWPHSLCMTLFYTPLGAMFCADISTRCWHWPRAICEIRWQSVNSLFIIIDKYLLWSPTTDRITVPLWLHLFCRNCALSTSQHANNNNYSPIQIARIIFIGCMCLVCLYYVLIHSDSSLYFFFFLVKCMHSATADCRSCSTKAKSIIVVAYR